MQRDNRSPTLSENLSKDNKFAISAIALISILMICCFLYYLVLLGNFLGELSSLWGIIIFTVLAGAAVGLGHQVLRSTKLFGVDTGERHSGYLASMYSALTVTFYVTTAIILAIIVESFIMLQYHVGLYVAAMSISYSLAAIITGVIGYKFFSWYRSSRDIFALVFGIGFAIGVAAFMAVALPNAVYFFSTSPFQMEGQNRWLDVSEPYYPSLKKDEALFSIYQLTLLPTRLGFVAFWAIAVLLTRNYYRQIGKFKFIAFASLPIIAYTIVTLNSVLGLESAYPLVAALLIPIGGTSAGVFIGAILGATSSKMRQSNHYALATYLRVAGLSLVLAFMALTPSVHVLDRTHTVFPPFGLVAHMFAPLAAYLLSLGFYFSATTISRDANIRRSLRRETAPDTSKFLGNLGMAQMEEQVRQTVEKVVKEQEETLKDESGIQQTVNEDEMKQYLDEALKEIRKTQIKK